MIGTRSDESKVILGCPRKGPEIVNNYDPDDGVVDAGVAVCLNSDALLEAGAANPPIGISRGVSMNHTAKNSVTLRGKEVPLKLTDLSEFASLVVGDLTFTAKVAGAAGNAITIALVDEGGGGGNESVIVDGTDIVVEMDDTAETGSTATHIKAAIDGDEAASALVSVTIAEGEGSTVQDDAAEDALEGGVDPHEYVLAGTAVFVDDVTGLATAEDDGTTETNWKYASGVLEGVSPAVGGESAPCALVNMGG